MNYSGCRQILLTLFSKKCRQSIVKYLFIVITLLLSKTRLTVSAASTVETFTSSVTGVQNYVSAAVNNVSANVSGNETDNQQPENPFMSTSLTNGYNTSVFKNYLIQRNFLIGIIDYAISGNNNNNNNNINKTNDIITTKCYQDLNQFLKDSVQQQLWTMKCM